MKKHFGLAVTIAVLIVAAFPIVAGADAGFGFRHDLDIRVRFENLDDYPTYDFYLKYSLSLGNPAASPHLTKVNAGTPTQLEGKGNRMTAVYLLAVPRGQEVVRPQSGRDGHTWLTEVPSGALQSAALPGALSRTQLGAESDGSTCSYRVQIEGDDLAVYWVGDEAQQSGGVTWLAWACALFAGLGLSAGLAVGGLVWLLRSRRTVQP